MAAKDISENKGYCAKVYKTNIFEEHEKENNQANAPIYTFIMKIPTLECINKMISESVDGDEKNEVRIGVSIKFNQEIIFSEA